MNICVFCASSSSAPVIYRLSAEEMGQHIASKGHTLIFGGGDIGLMREVAQSALRSGGRVRGVIPGYLRSREKRFEDADELILTETITERKRIMIEQADAFIILPGGFGTLEEFFEVLTAKIRDGEKKPIGILNTAGFYNQLFGFFDFLSHESFVQKGWKESIFISEKPIAVIDYIESKLNTDRST